jgi:16S rRNA (uracil1498-N3)-methyltransferase
MAQLQRLHLAEALHEGARVALSPEAAHYLQRVLRMEAGDAVLAFNGRDGEWLARLAPGDGRKGVTLELVEQRRVAMPGPDLTLFFAPLKKVRTDLIVEKATELGVARIVPVITQRTQAETVRPERLRLIAIEAAEQTGRLDVPEIGDAVKLDAVLLGLTSERALLFCDEGGDAVALGEWLVGRAREGGPCQPGAILIGPEGGFTPQERQMLRSRDCVVPVSLGPRVLRAETAALAALTLWQAHLGDWR